MKFATVRNEITTMIENGARLTKVSDYIDTLFIKKKINPDVYDKLLTYYMQLLRNNINAILNS